MLILVLNYAGCRSIYEAAKCLHSSFLSSFDGVGSVNEARLTGTTALLTGIMSGSSSILTELY